METKKVQVTIGCNDKTSCGRANTQRTFLCDDEPIIISNPAKNYSWNDNGYEPHTNETLYVMKKDGRLFFVLETEHIEYDGITRNIFLLKK